MELLTHVLEHAFEDTVHLVPFLFVTYLAMEFLEHRAGGALERFMARRGRAGALVGAVAGVVPQCGFSAAAATLYAARVITLGTLVAVFLSTSDELLPIFIAEQVPAPQIAAILGLKVLAAAVSGLVLDAVLHARHLEGDEHEHIHDLCEQEHCDCGHESMLLSALKHTVMVTVFIFLITCVLDGAMELVGEDVIAGFLAGNPALSVFASALVGLIPNCAASVLISQLYLAGALGFPAMMSGLLVSAGVGYLVLYRTNLHPRENLFVVGLIWLIGVAWGLVFSLL